MHLTEIHYNIFPAYKTITLKKKIIENVISIIQWYTKIGRNFILS